MAARRMAIMALMLCLCLSWLPSAALAVSTADAEEPISPERSCTLTISYTCEGIAFENLSVALYHIAAVDAQAQYTLTQEFQSCGVELNGVQTNGEWDAIRSTLEAHILAQGIAPTATALTDQNGQVTFGELTPGLYLAISGSGTYGGLVCTFRTALVALPGLDGEGIWQYEVAVAAKPEIVTQDKIEFRLLKLWKDDGNEEKRPENIEVDIFRDGELYETVILSEENNWSYHWTAPADGARWMVVERNIPEGYTATVEEWGAAFTITNTAPKDPPGTPQTGDSANIMLAVVLLHLSGAGLIALGLYRKRYEA